MKASGTTVVLKKSAFFVSTPNLTSCFTRKKIVEFGTTAEITLEA